MRGPKTGAGRHPNGIATPQTTIHEPVYISLFYRAEFEEDLFGEHTQEPGRKGLSRVSLWNWPGLNVDTLGIMSRAIKYALAAAPFLVLPSIEYLVLVHRPVFRSDCPFLKAIDAREANRIKASIENARRAVREIRAEGDLQLWDTPHGQFWIPQSSAGMLHWVIGEQRADIYNAAAMVHSGDIVLDCGADVGTFTRTALNHGAAQVIAVEPAPWKEPCLRRTFSREISEGKVVVYTKGVWSSDTTLLLNGDKITSDRGVEVPLTTIDHLVDDLRLQRLDVIKMDIEGAEKPAIQGGRETIRRFKPRFTVATEHNPDDYSAIPALLRSIEPTYKAQCGPCVMQFGRLQPYTVQVVSR